MYVCVCGGGGVGVSTSVKLINLSLLTLFPIILSMTLKHSRLVFTGYLSMTLKILLLAFTGTVLNSKETNIEAVFKIRVNSNIKV